MRHRLAILRSSSSKGLEGWLAERSAVDRLWLDGYLFSLGTEGAARNTYRGSREHLIAPAFQAYPPGEVLSSQPTGEEFSFRSLIVQPALVEQLVLEVMGTDRSLSFNRAVADTSASNTELGRHLWQVSEQFVRPASNLERHSSLLELTGAVLTHFARASAPPVRDERPAVRATLDYLLAYADQDIRFEELEAVAHLSPYHLIRVFKKAVGLTPAQFQLQARVRLAQKRLSAGLPIAQVAAEVGFADQAHLTRTFKRLLGLTPGQYMKDNSPD